MYPTTLTQLARANPFSAPVFTLQKLEEPKQPTSVNGQNRRFAAAAVADAGKKANVMPKWLAKRQR